MCEISKSHPLLKPYKSLTEKVKAVSYLDLTKDLSSLCVTCGSVLEILTPVFHQESLPGVNL